MEAFLYEYWPHVGIGLMLLIGGGLYYNDFIRNPPAQTRKPHKSQA